MEQVNFHFYGMPCLNTLNLTQCVLHRDFLKCLPFRFATFSTCSTSLHKTRSGSVALSPAGHVPYRGLVYCTSGQHLQTVRPRVRDTNKALSSRSLPLRSRILTEKHKVTSNNNAEERVEVPYSDLNTTRFLTEELTLCLMPSFAYLYSVELLISPGRPAE